jgi:hypothetical protein
MGNFFKPWRRKAGFVTLAMACMFLMVWGWGQGNATFIGVWYTTTTECNLSLDSRGFQLFNGEIAIDQATGIRQLNGIWDVEVSYWSIITPLTLLTAYLLLSKPRVAMAKSLSDITIPD